MKKYSVIAAIVLAAGLGIWISEERPRESHVSTPPDVQRQHDVIASPATVETDDDGSPAVFAPTDIADTVAGPVAAPHEVSTEEAAVAGEINAERPSFAGDALGTAISGPNETIESEPRPRADAVPTTDETALPANGLANLFTVQGFDYDAALAAIEARDVSATMKAEARSMLASTRDNPEALPEVLATISRMLGIAQRP